MRNVTENGIAPLSSQAPRGRAEREAPMQSWHDVLSKPPKLRELREALARCLEAQTTEIPARG
jgi:hypothetical protein